MNNTKSVTDAHVHIWAPNEIDYPWLRAAPAELQRAFDLDEAFQATPFVRRAVLVQAANCVGETKFLLRHGSSASRVVGVVGWVDLAAPERANTQLKELVVHPLFKGVRHLIHEEADPNWLELPHVLEGLGLLAAAQLPFEIVATRTEHLRCALTLAETHPKLQLVLDHVGGYAGGSHTSCWRELMAELAAYPHVSCKISGLGTALSLGPLWDAADIIHVLEYVWNLFGPDRLMMGSDWPVCNLAGGSLTALDAYMQCLNQLGTDEQLRQVLSGTAGRVYGISS